MSEGFPKQLQPARGPIRRDKLDGAAQGMGRWGKQTVALASAGLVPPDMMTGLTLFLLSSQPRDPASRQAMPGGGGGVAGGVWVRERFTIHRPLRSDEAFTVTGASEGRHVHKSRRYGTTSSMTRNSADQLACTNLTTGLLAYKVEEGLADQLEGRSPDEIDAPQPDWETAGDNPCLEALKSLRVGELLGGYPVSVSLALMEARDTKKPDNPIHSDPELARQAGLARPIAGGSHVLAFALEPIMARAGGESLLHGASFDIRWKAPVFADTVIVPSAEVTEATERQVTFKVQAVLEDGAVAMTGTVAVPLA